MSVKSLFLLLICLVLTESTLINVNTTVTSVVINMNSTTTTIKQNLTTITNEKKFSYIPTKEFLHDHFSKLNRNTIIWSCAAIATITCLISLYILVKITALRRKRQTRRYKLLSNATTMEEPLFNEHDDDEDERDNDTLFVRR